MVLSLDRAVPDGHDQALVRMAGRRATITGRPCAHLLAIMDHGALLQMC
jgi:hypothetical protein